MDQFNHTSRTDTNYGANWHPHFAQTQLRAVDHSAAASTVLVFTIFITTFEITLCYYVMSSAIFEYWIFVVFYRQMQWKKSIQNIKLHNWTRPNQWAAEDIIWQLPEISPRSRIRRNKFIYRWIWLFLEKFI